MTGAVVNNRATTHTRAANQRVHGCKNLTQTPAYGPTGTLQVSKRIASGAYNIDIKSLRAQKRTFCDTDSRSSQTVCALSYAYSNQSQPNTSMSAKSPKQVSTAEFQTTRNPPSTTYTGRNTNIAQARCTRQQPQCRTRLSRKIVLARIGPSAVLLVRKLVLVSASSRHVPYVLKFELHAWVPHTHRMRKELSGSKHSSLMQQGRTAQPYAHSA